MSIAVTDQGPRYEFEAVLEFTFNLLVGAGMPGEKAVDAADVLLEAELLGFRAHGLRMLPWYLEAVSEGLVEVEGGHDVVRDESSSLVWDGRYLPGPWLIKRAISEAGRRLMKHAVVTVVIRRSHYTGALPAYLESVAGQGFMIVLVNAGGGGWQAPPGKAEPVLPVSTLVMGCPTAEKPLLIELSTAAGLAAGEDRDRDGLMLGFLTQAWATALGGGTDDEAEKRHGASVFVQIIDPARFCGVERFGKEMELLAQISRSRSRVLESSERASLPGAEALARKEEQLKNGLVFEREIDEELRRLANEFSSPMPAPLR